MDKLLQNKLIENYIRQMKKSFFILVLTIWMNDGLLAPPKAS